MSAQQQLLQANLNLMWNCQRCTLQNSTQYNRCGACGTRRPMGLASMMFPIPVGIAADGRQVIVRVPLLLATNEDPFINNNNQQPQIPWDPNESFRPKLPPASDEQLSKLKIKIADGTDKDSCSVCLQAFSKNETLVVTTCNHTFHDQCAYNWFNVTGTCPICREVVGKSKHADNDDDKEDSNRSLFSRLFGWCCRC